MLQHAKDQREGKSVIARALSYVRFAIAGAIGGTALYNTFLLIFTAAPTQSHESVAMAAGAVLAAGLVKAFHVA